MRDWIRLQRAIESAARNLGSNLTLRQLAARTGQSSFHAHRKLRAVLGETPKQFMLRLRVDRAAAALLCTKDSILDIALACGFESHETFCRAFFRRYRMTPSGYRKRGLRGPGVRRHAELVDQIGRCVGLYHIDLNGRNSQSMEYAVSRKELAPQPVLVVRRRVRRADIAATIGAELPKVFLHAQQQGIAISGYPVTRYLEISVGMVTLETGMRVANHSGDWTAGNGGGDILAETLPGGPAAVTVHSGPYDQLPAAYAAIEQWIVVNGLIAAGAPWEAYLNDPTDHPNPEDWKTEVCWPLRA